MLGLERVLTEDPAHTAAGTELRRHQIDALTGMLAELIASTQRAADENGNGNGAGERRGRRGRARRGGRRRLRRRLRRRRARRARGAHGRPDPGAVRRYRFRHPTASGKTIAAAGFVEAARHLGILILTHRRLLVSQFKGDLTTEGYGDRFTDAIVAGSTPPSANPITIQTYAWFARHGVELDATAYHLVICDEAHTALGEKTSGAIRAFAEPLYIGMTATEQLIAKQVSDVFPASVDDLPLGDAARRGLIAPLRCLRVPPAAAINSVPIVGGDFEERALAAALDHQALNHAAASLYRERFGSTPGIVYAAGVEHAYNLAQEFRAAGLKAEAVSGRTPPARLAETLAAYERGEINVLINAMLLAEGWNSPRATVCMHLAPTASRRVYQQRIGRIMRIHPRKEAGVVVDFVPKSATHSERVVSLHALLDSDFYREGARVTPAPRRRQQRRARRKLSPVPWLVPVTPDVARQARRHPARVAADRPEVPGRRRAALLGDDRRAPDPVRPARRVREEVRRGPRGQGRARAIPLHVRGREPEPPAPHDRADGSRRDARRPGRLRRPRHARDAGAAVGEGPRGRRADPAPRDRRGKAARAGPDPRPLDVAARARDPQGAGPPGLHRVPRGEAPARRGRELTRLPARGERQPTRAGRARDAASRRRRAPRLRRRLHATRQLALDHAREELGTISEIANALADNLPLPKLTARKSRRRRRKRKPAAQSETTAAPETEETTGDGRTSRRSSTAEPPASPTDVEDAA